MLSMFVDSDVSCLEPNTWCAMRKRCLPSPVRSPAYPFPTTEFTNSGRRLRPALTLSCRLKSSTKAIAFAPSCGDAGRPTASYNSGEGLLGEMIELKRDEPADRADLSSVSLEHLLGLYQRGEREAAEAVIERVSPALHRFFAIQTGDRRHADDLLQDAWLRIHRALHTYRPGQPALPWLYAIARHVRVDAYRRRRWERFEEVREPMPEPAAVSGEANGDLPDIDTLLAGLPESQREVVSLLKIAGLSLDEVACATFSTVGAVKQKAHRAYERLRVTLARFAPAAATRGESR